MALAEFDNHVRSGSWRIHHGSFGDFATARDLIDTLPNHPLRAIDALHLAAARSCGATHFATADKTQAEAAAALGFTVHRFY
jgi:predicted nucleic acid-binding protein